MKYPHRHASLGFAGLAAVVPILLGSVGLLCSLAHAQEPAPEAKTSKYLELQVDESQKAKTMMVKKMCRDGTLDDPQMFRDFFTQYVLPDWTLAKNRATLAEDRGQRKNLRTQYLNIAGAAPNQQAHTALNKLVLDYMDKLVRSPRIDPVVRVNAALMIGDLNETEPATPVQPLPEALDVLLAMVDNPKLPDAVKVAALVGISRHAAAPDGLAAEPKNKVIVSLTALAIAPLPADRRPDGPCWIRGQAAEILGLLRSAGNGGSVPAALLVMLKNPALSVSARCAAARALGQLNYGGVAFSPGPCVQELGKLAVDCLAAEEQNDVSRRRLKFRLQCVSNALAPADGKGTGIGGLVKDAALRGSVEKLQQTLQTITGALDDGDKDAAALKKAVADTRIGLERSFKGS
ncbi:MAG: hypothetical protein ABSG68_19870 [Thermoguttaceae bacterium]